MRVDSTAVDSAATLTGRARVQGGFKDKPGGRRHVLIPQHMCAEVATAGKIMEVLCCANTHVNCSAAVAEPTLIPGSNR